MTISVLVVDDSVVVRKLVTSVLDADPDLAVVGTAPNGRIALAKIAQLRPDLVTLDIEMPEMDGLETLRQLRRTDRALPVVMFSTLTERAAQATLEALSLGADDYVTKPANVGSVTAAMEAVRAQLVPKVKALCAARRPVSRVHPAAAHPAALSPTAPRPTALDPRAARAAAPVPGVRPAAAAPRPVAPAAAPSSPGLVPQVLAIGCSTGGPEALGTVLRALPASLPVPVVVVQHMPPLFTAMFAQRLDAQCALRVREAEDGDRLEPGRVLIAPGDFHMTVSRAGALPVVRLDSSAQENFCRPAVDPLFRSLAQAYGSAVLALVLTGMGQDGLLGAGRLREAGAPVLVQDAATSTVWGMPGAIANAGLATAVLPLPQVAPAVLGALGALRPAVLAAGAR